MNLTYKNALITDLSEIVAIYNSTIASGMVTADTKPVTVKSKLTWFHQHNSATRPLWLIRNEQKKTLGWISFQSFYGRPAYNATAELSIYIHESFRGKGIGKIVLDHCISAAPGLGIKTLLGFIFQHNLQSLKLFHNKGFNDWGTLPNVAVIEGTERTLIIVGRRLDES